MPTANPISVAIDDSTRASANNWPAMRARLAPSALRTRDLGFTRRGAREHQRRDVGAAQRQQADEEHVGGST